jgi:L-glyceraldehyde 3-phosphate reductase
MRGQSFPQMASAWGPRDTRVTSALIGAGSSEQLTESVAALSHLRFTTEELVQIDKDAVEGDVNLRARSSEVG